MHRMLVYLTGVPKKHIILDYIRRVEDYHNSASPMQEKALMHPQAAIEYLRGNLRGGELAH